MIILGETFRNSYQQETIHLENIHYEKIKRRDATIEDLKKELDGMRVKFKKIQDLVHPQKSRSEL